MLRTIVDERPYSQELLSHALRRRRRPILEAQSPRCPLCERIMVLCFGRRGPRFRCGCAEVKRDG
jgi:hypothetical protein